MGKFLLLKAWKWKYYNEKIEKGLKLLRSLEMLANREIEISDFSFALVYSNNNAPSQYSASRLIERTTYDAPMAMVLYTDIFTSLQLLSHGYSRLYYFADLTLDKNIIMVQ